MVGSDALGNVWKRSDEALIWFVNGKDNFQREQGIDAKKLAKICKEEGTTLGKFLPYAQKRAKKDHSK